MHQSIIILLNCEVEEKARMCALRFQNESPDFSGAGSVSELSALKYCISIPWPDLDF